MRAILLVTSVLTLGAVLSGCSATGDSVRKAFGTRKASFQRPILSTMPCVKDAIRTTFGVPAESQGSYAEPQVVERTHVKFKLLVRLDPSATKEPAETSRTVRYEFYHRSDTETGVNFDVDFKGALRDEWLEQAFIPLEQCGAKMLR